MAMSAWEAAQASGIPEAMELEVASADGFDRIIGRDGGLRETVERARRLTRVDTPLLLQGETGVGKEVFARAIHSGGPNPSAPFVALNCGGLPRELLASELFGYVEGAFTGARRSGMIGKIEGASGGTLFLDEISQMPMDLQPYLLRVLEGGEMYPLGSARPRRVQFRLISACNQRLRDEVGAGRFRTDLFYRISGTTLTIPCLRDRRQDLRALVDRFACDVADRHQQPPKIFSGEVLRAFERYTWPGNVRELRNVVEGMVLLSEGHVVGLDTLPVELRGDATGPLGSVLPQVHPPELGQWEREAISAAIRQRQGNLTRAAKDLGIARSTLYLKLKRHALDPFLSEVRLEALS
ncbi:MAG TPA: sigma 54-interacting transcriptional regulator [Polyangiaceae bacterium]|nr:sigma 54-interacting transcriptional regulator [Polyangiaceae bacterium]